MIYDTVLVTGCMGDVAMEIARIIRESSAARRIIGCDVCDSGRRDDVFDAHVVGVPRAGDPKYFDELRRLIDRDNVDVVIPTSDAELGHFLSARLLQTIDGVPVIAANSFAVQVGLDKLETNRHLVRVGVPAPWTRRVGLEIPASFPCVLKPRIGQGSKNVMRVDAADFSSYAALGDAYIWQELILPDDQEYTCGVYRTAKEEIRTISFRRQLRGGRTASAEVTDNASIEKLLHAVACSLQLTGSINVQLRLSHDGPKIFEINPRFSSTVGFRDQLGFRDVVWALLESRGLNVENYIPAKAGVRLQRTVEEDPTIGPAETIEF